MRIAADFHIHSRFSRACSKHLTLSSIGATCAVRGIDLVTTGDFTHPEWRKDIGEQLEEVASGIFRLRNTTTRKRKYAGDSRVLPSVRASDTTRFLLGTELSCIAKHGGKTRRVHHLVLMPSFSAVDRLVRALDVRGCNLHSDGRPILGLTSKALLEMCLDADARALLIPAHAWTPWFAVFGSESGYDSLEECFEDLTPHILAIETGLSSDPAMNWRVSALDHVALVSSSDAHSLEKLGREATILELESVTFANISDAMRASAPVRFRQTHANRIVQTIEFFPEEGKYHLDGHRACGVRCTPEETKRKRGICPQCRQQLTIGVMHRVDNLADRAEHFVPPYAPTYTSIVPLIEIVMEAFGVRSMTRRVRAAYDQLTEHVGSEFNILLDASLENIAQSAPPEVVEAIRRVRAAQLDIAPGYDGEFGTVRIFSAEHPRPVAQQFALL